MPKKEKVSRRKFIKHGSVSTVAVAVSQVSLSRGQVAGALPSSYDRELIFAKLGDTLIPSSPGDPGYKTLEPYNITAEIMKGVDSIPDEDLALFNSESAAHFGGQTFVELSEANRADYLNMIADGVDISDSQVLGRLQSVYRLVRLRVFVVYYQNYPQHTIMRDEAGVPILSSDNEHQITNPNQPGLVNGCDIAGWRGPLTWEEEEERRERFKKVKWKEY
ncbi:MAG: twin-arginine translocation signal domain-containing protein [Acidobacteria bacterium]|nr:twin-arginine translocation signal domain-containing protein [Acidobacteriota bacterium]